MFHVYFNYSSCVFHVCFLAAKADQERTISFRKWDSLYEPFMLYKSKASLDMFIWVKRGQFKYALQANGHLGYVHMGQEVSFGGP